jgi:hypothetical protein
VPGPHLHLTAMIERGTGLSSVVVCVDTSHHFCICTMPSEHRPLLENLSERESKEERVVSLHATIQSVQSPELRAAAVEQIW